MIAILLCTFNGANYLKEQLDSLFTQSNQDFIVYYHDDGSDDDTLNILKEYSEKYKGRIVPIGGPVHMGPKMNFCHLLENVYADYYMFCDQDDVWKPTKIEMTLKKMLEIEAEHPEKPILVHTDLEIVDQDLHTVHKSFWKWKRFHVDVSKHFLFLPHGHIVTGCTMMINNKCKQVGLPISHNAHMHDEWFALIAAKYGICDNIKNQTILYRQHGNNVCSAGTSIDNKRIFNWVFKFPSFYRSQRPLLDDIEYGSGVKFFITKLIYNVVRLF